MTTKTEIVRARVTPSIKLGAQKVLFKLGLSVSDAINLLLVQIDMKKALPFAIEMPNEKTCKVLDECERGVGLKKCKDAKDFFNQLRI
jgi:addiction module antitoxin, RelB/DinJ family